MSHLRKIASYTGIMVMLSVLLKPIGIAKDMLVASKFGVNADLGIYFLFMGIATFFASMMYSMHRGSITPSYIKIKLSGDNSQAYSLAILSGFVYILLVTCVCCILYVFIVPLIHFFAPGFTADKVIAASKSALYLVVLLASMAANDFFTSVLEAEKRFVSTRLSQACISITVIAIVWFYHQNGWVILLQGLALGYLIAATIQALVYITIIKSTRFCFRKAIPKLKEVLPLWLAMAAGAFVANSRNIIDRMMITILGGHELAVFGYADTLVSNVSGILILSVNTAVLPIFSAISADNKHELNETAFKTYRYAIAFILPIVLVLSIYGDILIRIIYQRGNFSNSDTNDVFNVLKFLIIAIIPTIGVVLLARVYSVLYDAKTTVYAAIISSLLNISFNYILMQSYGVAGIALSTVLVNLVIVLFFTLILSIKHNMRLTPHNMLGFLGLLMTGTMVWYASTLGRQYGLPTSILIFFITFPCCIYIFRLHEYQQGFTMLYNKVRIMI
jgi:putative peptidoglycan lipid II flippase